MKVLVRLFDIFLLVWLTWNIQDPGVSCLQIFWIPPSFTFHLMYIEILVTGTVNCIKCTKTLKFSWKCLKCHVCHKQIHVKSSRLNKQGFWEYNRGSSFTCQFCLDYCCLQCNNMFMFIMVKKVFCALGVLIGFIRNVQASHH